MLVLTRKVGQYIDMELPNGDYITMKIVESREGTVAVGIEAPSNVNITRDDAVKKQPKDSVKRIY